MTESNNEVNENPPWPVYNADGSMDDSYGAVGSADMRKTLTTIRCVPRFGFEHADVRTLDIDLYDSTSEQEIRTTLNEWFTLRGIQDAVYDTDVDDYGFFAILNDEVYLEEWGEPLL